MIELNSRIYICKNNQSIMQKAGTIPNVSSKSGFARWKKVA